MHNCFVAEVSGKIIPILPICESDFPDWIKMQSSRDKNLIRSNNFSAKPNSFCLLTDSDGNLEKVLLGLANKNDFFAFGVLPQILPTGCYDIVAPDFSWEQLDRAFIGWGMGSYQFKQYKEVKEITAKLLCQKNCNIERTQGIIDAIFLVRDLINEPSGVLYPEKLAEIALDLAIKHRAEIKIIKGEELVAGFPAVQAVGSGSCRQPLLIDLHYGDADAPKIVLVGKGVCFDSGGLQIKSSGAMLLMKKDMAGAAHALGLAQMIMNAKLPVNLRVIIPAVENLVSGNSIKPGDIIKTRKGISIEVVNTDAEGRLILADALAFASEWQPKLILDFATLTGAARVALGPDITALFANDNQLANDIITHMTEEQEPIWLMPLYQPYLEFLTCEIADFKNIASVDYAGAGAILAALLLEQFIAPKIQWAHFDINAYNATTKPGKPAGGEASCLMGVFKYIEQCFGKL